MRAQLGSDSFVTGLMYVALDSCRIRRFRWSRRPDPPPRKSPPCPTPSNRRRPSCPNLRTLHKVDFSAVFAQMTGMLESIKEITTRPRSSKWSTIRRRRANNSTNFRRRAADSQHRECQVPPLSKSLQKTSGSADASAKQAALTLGTVQTTIEPSSPINYQALQTLQDVSAAVHSIRSWRTTCNVIRARSSRCHSQPVLTDDLDQFFQNFPGGRNCAVDDRMLIHGEAGPRPAKRRLEVLSPHAHRGHRSAGASSRRHQRQFHAGTGTDQASSPTSIVRR